jgi:uncharacterized protein YndB with AHSA1/START domain
MAAGKENNPTKVERTSDRDVVVTRIFDAPARLVFKAWTTPALFQRWWIPKSFPVTLLSYTADVRVGGGYRVELEHGGRKMAFFGTYLEVVPDTRLVWTNEESEDGAVTTVTLAEKDGKTLLTMHERYPSREALDRSAGATDGLPETFAQLDEILTALA